MHIYPITLAALRPGIALASLRQPPRDSRCVSAFMPVALGEITLGFGLVERLDLGVGLAVIDGYPAAVAPPDAGGAPSTATTGGDEWPDTWR